MPILQATPRKSATKQAALANRLLAATSIAQHVLNATIDDSTSAQPVIRCKAQSRFIKGGVFVNEAQAFYLVRSAKWSHLYYVCIYTKEQGWRCSSSEPQVSQKCIEQAKAYKLSLLDAQKQREDSEKAAAVAEAEQVVKQAEVARQLLPVATAEQRQATARVVAKLVSAGVTPGYLKPNPSAPTIGQMNAPQPLNVSRSVLMR